MHQSTQRRICRLVFIAGCVLPTLAVASWAAVERLPGTTAMRLAAVEHRIGLRVHAQSLSTPVPGVYRAEGLQLANIETGEVVLAAEIATLRSAGTHLHVDLRAATLRHGELVQLGVTASRLLALDWPREVTLRLHGINWRGDVPPSAAALLADRSVTLNLSTKEHQGAITGRELSLQLADAESGPRLAAHRNRQVTPPTTRVVVNTDGQAVPAEWMANLGCMLAWDSNSTFTGDATFTRGVVGASGQLTGELSSVSLASLTQLPLDGMARIRGLKLQWEAGRITSAEGVLTCGPGILPGSLARTLQSLYKMPQAGLLVGEEESLPFGAVGATFLLNESSLSLWGACDSSESANTSPLMVDEADRVLFGQPDYRAPLGGVSAVLASHGGERAAGLAARLPRLSKQ